VIKISGLYKSFGDQRALAGVDAEVGDGKIVCLVGPSGCGKSTLLRCLNGLETFDRGSIEIAGFTLSSRMSPEELVRLRSRVGMVFQEFHLFPHLTVLGNVTLAPRVVEGKAALDTEARARELLREVHLESREGAYPSELSGGQKQRVAIARALARPLSVLLLDEPTSALDPEMREEVREVLREIATRMKLTMVLVTHDMRLATSLADEMWRMDAGKIVERGSPDEIAPSLRQ
jgi:polar amino acid transport system ATP-binding protein